MVHKHLPFFYLPLTACWLCRVKLAQDSCRRRHSEAYHQGENVCDMAESKDWASLMLGFLFALSARLGFVPLDCLTLSITGKVLPTDQAQAPITSGKR